MRTTNKLQSQKAQAILQYALLASIVAALSTAMVLYVYRSVQATQQMIDRESRK